MPQLLHGDCLAILPTLPTDSIHCVVTSPPYYGLRDYNVDDQIGLEDTPELYIERLVEVFRHVHRVLRPDGTLWLNLGDSYATSPPGNKGPLKSGLSNTIENLERRNREHHKGFGNYKPKDLMMMPARIALALQADGWWLRSDIIWHKTNVMPESVKDRPTSAHEHVFLLAKSERYYYDGDAIRQPYAGTSRYNTPLQHTGPGTHRPGSTETRREITTLRQPNPLGANARNVWSITPKRFKGAHFATFPVELAERCILAGSRPGDLLLDPFGGAGTTAYAAIKHGRDAILIELNEDYLEMARKRLLVVA